MTERHEPWYQNGWIVGTGTTVISVFVLKALDWIFGTKILATISSWLVGTTTLPVWLLAGVAILLFLAGWLVRLTLSRSRERRERDRRLRIVPSPFACHWSDAKKGDEPAMSLDLRATATNVSEVPVYIVRAYVPRPRSEAWMLMVKAVDSNIHGNYPIPPGETTDVVAHFGVHPPIVSERQEVVVDLVFVDNFETEHRVRGVRFHPPPEQKRRPEYPRESIHAIVDPIEKQVAAILKAEVARYQRAGRGQGGIGSVYTVRDGRTMAGVPSDAWTHGSYENSYITSDPNAQVASENVDALENVYRKLETEADRQRYIQALTARVKCNTEYAPVAYIALLSSLRVGQLGEALRAAKMQLRGDSEYGFDEFVRVLAALLTNQHQIFTDTDLDDIERFVEGVSEYTYEIISKLAAVRAYRLRHA